MRQERHEQQDLRRGEFEVGADGGEVHALAEAEPPRRDRRQQRDQRGHRNREQDEGGPAPSVREGQHPSCHEGHEGRRRRERPPQVVDHFPAADERDGPAAPGCLGCRSPADDPRQKLPVPARPTILASGRHVIPCRELVDHLDVGDQGGAGEDALEKIVAEDGVVRNASGEGRFEAIDVVDPLAAIGAFAEQVLVHVRDGTGIGVHAACVGKDALKK